MARRKRQTLSKPQVIREINPETGRTDLRTGYYEPIRAHAYWQHPRDLPWFNFDIIRLMLWDPAILLALKMRAAPLASVQFAYQEGEQWIEGIEAQRPEVGAFVHRQLMKIWQNHIDEIASSQIWGWSSGEVTLKLSKYKLVEVARMEPRQARDCKVMTRDGSPCGVQISRVTHEGKVELPFPKAWFHNHDPEAGEYYGRSVLLGAYSPWADKWLDGGALDVRRLFMHKDAYGGSDLGYPEGSTLIGEQDVPNRDIARQIVEQLAAGGVTTRPSTRDENGNEKWPLTRAVVPSNPSHILQYPQDLDAEIRRGIGVPDDVIDNDGGGAWAGKRIPLAAFYASLDSWVRRILTDLNEQVIEPLVVMNFGGLQDYEICHKPLAKQAMEQQGNAGEGMGEGEGMFDSPASGGGSSWQPHTTKDGRQAWKSPGGRVAVGPTPPGQRMSLNPIDAVGEGVLSAAELVKAARMAINFREEDHPRDRDGKFISSGNATATFEKEFDKDYKYDLAIRVSDPLQRHRLQDELENDFPGEGKELLAEVEKYAHQQRLKYKTEAENLIDEGLKLINSDAEGIVPKRFKDKKFDSRDDAQDAVEEYLETAIASPLSFIEGGKQIVKKYDRASGEHDSLLAPKDYANRMLDAIDFAYEDVFDKIVEKVTDAVWNQGVDRMSLRRMARWITVKPNGEDETGRPVMIDKDGKVIAGAGGALDGKTLTPKSKESKGPPPKSQPAEAAGKRKDREYFDMGKEQFLKSTKGSYANRGQYNIVDKNTGQLIRIKTARNVTEAKELAWNAIESVHKNSQVEEQPQQQEQPQRQEQPKQPTKQPPSKQKVSIGEMRNEMASLGDSIRSYKSAANAKEAERELARINAAAERLNSIEASRMSDDDKERLESLQNQISEIQSTHADRQQRRPRDEAEQLREARENPVELDPVMERLFNARKQPQPAEASWGGKTKTSQELLEVANEAYEQLNQLIVRRNRNIIKPPAIEKVGNVWILKDPDTGKGFFTTKTREEALSKADTFGSSAPTSMEVDQARERWQKLYDQANEAYEKEQQQKQQPQPAETATGKPQLEKVKASSIDTPAQGMLNAARERKKFAHDNLKRVREQVKNRQANRLDLMKAEESHREAVRAEQTALDAIEKRARELGKTTGRQSPEERHKDELEKYFEGLKREGKTPSEKLLKTYESYGGDVSKYVGKQPQPAEAATGKPNQQMKAASDVTARIKHQINLDLKTSNPRIFKRGGKRFILVDGDAGKLFNQIGNQISRLQFIDSVEPNGNNQTAIYLKD